MYRNGMTFITQSLEDYAAQCEAERLAARITQDVILMPEFDEEELILRRAPACPIDDGDPWFVPYHEMVAA